MAKPKKGCTSTISRTLGLLALILIAVYILTDNDHTREVILGIVSIAIFFLLLYAAFSIVIKSSSKIGMYLQSLVDNAKKKWSFRKAEKDHTQENNCDALPVKRDIDNHTQSVITDEKKTDSIKDLKNTDSSISVQEIAGKDEMKDRENENSVGGSIKDTEPIDESADENHFADDCNETETKEPTSNTDDKRSSNKEEKSYRESVDSLFDQSFFRTKERDPAFDIPTQEVWTGGNAVSFKAKTRNMELIVSNIQSEYNFCNLPFTSENPMQFLLVGKNREIAIRDISALNGILEYARSLVPAVPKATIHLERLFFLINDDYTYSYSPDSIYLTYLRLNAATLSSSQTYPISLVFSEVDRGVSASFKSFNLEPCVSGTIDYLADGSIGKATITYIESMLRYTIYCEMFDGIFGIVKIQCGNNTVFEHHKNLQFLI